MSTDFYMACHDCKKLIWIAQEGFSGRTLYYGMPHVMKPFRDFLFEHAGHQLDFVREQVHEDYEEVAWWPEEPSLVEPTPTLKSPSAPDTAGASRASPQT